MKTEKSDDLSKLRIRVAELCGWEKDIGVGRNNTEIITWHHSSSGLFYNENQLPDYPNDLNACREFEETIRGHSDTRWSIYCDHLAELTESLHEAIHATAEQRCRAFVALHDAQEAPAAVGQ